MGRHKMKKDRLDLGRELVRSEGNINLIRVIIFVLLGGLFVIKHWTPGYFTSPVYWVHIALLVVGFSYSTFVFLLSRKSELPVLVPYISVSLDVIMITMTLISAPFTAQTDFPDNRFITTSAIFSLYFLTIIFSALRQKPVITLLAALLSALLYGGAVLTSPFVQNDFHILANEIFKVAFLLITGLVATVSAKQLDNILTRARKNEQYLEESDRRLRSLGAKIPGAILQLLEYPQGSWQITYASEGIDELFELKNPEPLKDPHLLYEKLFPEDRERLISRMADKTIDNTTWTEEFQAYSASDGHHWIRFIVSSETTSQGGRIFHALLLNITARKHAELEVQKARSRAEASNEAKTNFLANMSHELRTPLNAILGVTELMRHSKLGEEAEGNLDIISHATENLLQIINDILDFSRLEAGKLRINKTYFDLRKILSDILDLFSPQAKYKGLFLHLIIEDKVPGLILGDMVRIRQIIVNLLSNALKFTSSGNIHLHASARLVSGREYTIELSVRDSGIGIHPQDTNLIFEKFTQADNSKTRVFGGTGLGLSISRNLALLMDGTVSVESILGEGSLFVFSFPSMAQPKMNARKETILSNSYPDLPAFRILLVEDNETNQDVQSRLLQKLGVIVDIASSGHEAIEKVKSNHYDLVFMDWQMPVMDGQETTRQIREFLQGRRFPIVALSGHALPGDRETLLASGFDDYLSKPVRLANFREILQKWCLSDS